jgi:hypothetical protein
MKKFAKKIWGWICRLDFEWNVDRKQTPDPTDEWVSYTARFDTSSGSPRITLLSSPASNPHALPCAAALDSEQEKQYSPKSILTADCLRHLTPEYIGEPIPRLNTFDKVSKPKKPHKKKSPAKKSPKKSTKKPARKK